MNLFKSVFVFLKRIKFFYFLFVITLITSYLISRALNKDKKNKYLISNIYFKYKNYINGLIFCIVLFGILIPTLYGNWFGVTANYIESILGLDQYKGFMIPFLVFIPSFVYVFLFNRKISDFLHKDFAYLFTFNTIILFLSLYTFSILMYPSSSHMFDNCFSFKLFDVLYFFILILLSFFVFFYKNILDKFLLLVIYIILLFYTDRLLGIEYMIKSDDFYVQLLVGLILSAIFNYIELFYMKLTKQKK